MFVTGTIPRVKIAASRYHCRRLSRSWLHYGTSGETTTPSQEMRKWRRKRRLDLEEQAANLSWSTLESMGILEATSFKRYDPRFGRAGTPDLHGKSDGRTTLGNVI